MAAPSETLNALNNILNQLKKMGDSTAKAMDAQRQKNTGKKGGNRSFIDYTKAIDNLEKDTTKLDKTFKTSQRTLEKSTKSVSESLASLAKDAMTPGRAIKQATKEWQESLDQMVKSQNADYQKLAKNTRDYIHNNKSSGIANIRNANNAFKDSMNILRNISRNHGKISQEDKKAFKDARDKMMGSLKDGQLRGKAFQDVTKKQLELFDKVAKGGKLTVAQLGELSRAAAAVNKNFTVMTEVSEDYSKQYAATVKVFRESLLKAVKGIGAGIAQALGAAVPQIFKDVMAQAQNAVQTSQYRDILKMGISQAQLAQFIGQNRLALRTLGGGSSTAPFSNGQMNQLQNQAHNFGLTGEDALKYIGSTFDNLIRLGLTPTVKNTSQAMDVLYKTMQETGMSFNQLNGMVEDLSKSAAFTDLIRANGYKGQADQIEILGKLLATTRYSTGYLKEMLEMNKQAKFQGIAEMVKGQVGIGLVSNLIRSHGGNISGLDEALAQMENRGMAAPQIAALMKQGKLDQFSYNGKKLSEAFKNQADAEQYILGLGGRFNEARLGVNNRMAAAGGGLGMGLFNSQFDQFASLMGNMGKMFNPDEALQAQSQRMGLFGTVNPTVEQQQKLLGANDNLISSINQVSNAFLKLSGIMPDTLAKLHEAAEGAQKNPAIGLGGATAGGLWKVLKNTIELGGISGGMLTLSKALGSKLGFGGRILSGISGMGGVMGTVGSKLVPLVPGIGAAASGFAEYQNSGSITKGVATGGGTLAGAELGAGLGSAVLPGIGTAVGAILGAIIGGLAVKKGADVLLDGSKPNVSVLQKAAEVNSNVAVDSQGNTTGDLMSMSVDRLTELVKIGKDQLDLMLKVHQEQMDAMSDQQNNKAIQDARNATLHTLVAGH